MIESILDDKKNELAFKEVMLEDAEKAVNKNVWTQRLQTYGKIILIPNIAAGIVGGITGGLEGAIETVKQVNYSLVPANILIQALVQSKKERFETTKDFIKEKLNFYKGAVHFDQMKKYRIATYALGSSLSAGVYSLTAFLAEKVINYDINVGLMALVGAVGGLSAGLWVDWKTKQIRDKVLEKAKNIKLEKQETNKIETKQLERLVDLASINGKKVDEIYRKSHKRLFSNNYEEFDKEYPNITLNLNSINFWGSKYQPVFNLNTKVEKSNEDYALEFVNTIKNNSDLDLKIHAMFDPIKLDEFKNNPYKGIDCIIVRGQKDDVDYFEIKYHILTDEINVDIDIKSRDYLKLVPEIFKLFYDRDLDLSDFNPELKTLDIPPEKHELKEIGIPINNFQPNEKMNHDTFPFGFDEDNKEKEIYIINPEQPDNIEDLAEEMINIYEKEKQNLKNSKDLTVALGEGTVILVGTIYILY
ncbi:hypothetical protein ACFL1H_00920, partial [Nanoarchaeota archaeon]